MVNSVKQFNGLPIFDVDPEAVLCDIRDKELRRARMAELAASGRTKFIRQARINAVKAKSLEEIVSTADRLFERSAEIVGAKVVPHVWGLYTTDNPFERFLGESEVFHADSLLPDGFVLAAEVGVIRHATKITSYEDNPSFYDLHNTMVTVDGYRWRDRGCIQYVLGTGPDQETDGYWQVDIEPILSCVA